MSQENQNQPALSTERKEAKNFVENFYKQPNIGLQQPSLHLNTTQTPSPLYECNLCSKKYTLYQDLENHNKTHSFFNFACWVCKRNFRMTKSDMISHFKDHEHRILLRTGYTRVIENQLYSVIEKNFGDEWPVTVFRGEFLNELTDVIRINALIKQRMIIQIRVKLWYVPNPSSEFNVPKFVWLTLPNIQFEWSDLNIKRKVFDTGEEFMNQFLEQTSVDDESGSGFVYYATSDVSIKSVKNSKIGCRWREDTCHKYSELLNHLSTRNVIFNPSCDSFCFKKCLEYFEYVCEDIQLSRSNKIFNQPYVTFADFEEWDQDGVDFGLRLLILDEENLNVAHPIFVNAEFHTKEIQINLLVIPNKNDSAHFSLVLNLNSFLRTLKNFNQETKTKKTTFFCEFCLIKNSQRYSVISTHQKFCLNNPVSKDSKTEIRNMIEFEKEKVYLKCSNRGRDPPNWIGFLDFETVTSDFDPINTDVCLKHSTDMLSCKCSFTVKGKALESLSYSIIIVDFNTDELLFETFYIPKNSTELSAAEHFVSILKKLAYTFQIINEINYPIEMSESEKRYHDNQTHCQRCGIEFSNQFFIRKSKYNLNNILNSANLETIKTMSNDGTWKTSHHIHHLKRSNFSATICSKCNLRCQSRYQQIPILCHNFSRFDHVLITKELCRGWPKNVSFIPKSLNNIIAIFANPFVLKDSLNFLSGSLDENVKIVKESCKKKCEKCKSTSQCKQCKIRTEQNFRKIFPTIYSSNLSKVNGAIDMNRFLSHLEKSAFPYSILTSYTDLKNMKTFPTKDKFDSVLKKDEVNQSEYESAKGYFELYCKNMYDFLKVYNSLDTHLLFSVWRVMSKNLSSQFGFYLEQFSSLPGYSLEVAKSFTPHPHLPEHTCIELFNESNKDIYFKTLENIRGGIVMVNSRFELDSRLAKFIDLNKGGNLSELGESKVEDSKLGENLEELLYLDATNLYGFCLSSLLPFKNYLPLNANFINSLNNVIKMTNIEKKCKLLDSVLPDDSPQGFAFEIKLVFIPPRLYEFPPFFAQQNVKSTDVSKIDKEYYKNIDGKEYMGNRNKKLIPLLGKDKSTFCHYKLLKEAIKQGVIVEAISGISFGQKYLFRDYITILAKLRANSTNPAHARSLKLLSNALFGKLLQSVIKYNRNFAFFFLNDLENANMQRINQLIQERHRGKKRILKDIKILDEDFFAIETQDEKVKATNCPLIAFSILEIAKARNFSFFWKMKNISPNTKMLYCDTDSFIIKCYKSWYKEVKSIKDEFDFSKAAFKFSHLMNISMQEKIQNGGIIGKYKSEIDKDSVLMGYIALQKKCYCLLIFKKILCPVCQIHSSICKCKSSIYQGKQLYYLVTNPTAKGKNVNKLNFHSYLESILFNRWKSETRVKISQERKKLFFSFMKYKSIICFDDSNFSLDCRIHNVPFSDSNHIFNKCYAQSCKFSFEYLTYLFENLEKMTNQLFYFENGALKCWSPPSSLMPLPPLLPPFFPDHSPTTTQISPASNSSNC